MVSWSLILTDYCGPGLRGPVAIVAPEIFDNADFSSAKVVRAAEATKTEKGQK